MTKKLYKPVFMGALLIASAGMSAFGQGYPQGYPQTSPQPGYQQQGYGNQAYGSQLDNLVAPIALYPDSLLSQVLAAAAFPQQLAEASQWLSQAGNLQGEQRIDAARQQNWDPSVQALVAFPDVLQRLTQDPQWAAELGNAFQNNQGAVMNAVQEMRQRAQQSGRLQSNPQQTVNVDTYNGQPAIDIVPTNPDVVYVPSYDPAYIWGPPAYGYYPRLYYPSYGFGFGGGIAVGAFFGYGGGFGHWGSRGYYNGYRGGGPSFYSGYSGGRQNFGRNYNSYQQPAYRGNGYQQQGFRSSAPQQSSRPQYSQPQYTQRQYSQPQARSFSQPQQSRSFQSAPRQQYSRQQSSGGGGGHQEHSGGGHNRR